VSRGDAASEHHGRPEARGPRRFAEWLSFGISLTLVLAVVFYLLWRLREPVTDTVLAQVSPQLDRVSEQQGRFVLPIQVKNPGSRTVRDLQLRVEYRERGEARSLDVLIDYVGQSAEQLVYVYFAEDPRSLSVRAEAISYLVD
jgi:uncharacterized protein (TIGR02588 family)